VGTKAGVDEGKAGDGKGEEVGGLGIAGGVEGGTDGVMRDAAAGISVLIVVGTTMGCRQAASSAPKAPKIRLTNLRRDTGRVSGRTSSAPIAPS
jgi:hypothetical protein